MRKLNLDNFKKGQSGISPKFAETMLEAAIFCLTENGHKSGVILKIDGYIKEEIQLFWSIEINNQIKRSWQDLKEAAEYGATALGALLISYFEHLEAYERIPPNGDADYFLQDISTKQITALLEVSGIWKKSPTNTADIRVNIKKKRLDDSEYASTYPIYIVVTEFSEPKSKINKYD